MRAAAIALAATSLGGCATAPLFTARDDVHRFFVAVRDDDQRTFDGLVVQDSLTHSVVLNRCYNAGLRGRPLARCVETTSKPPAPIPPSAFRKIAASYGYRPGQGSSGPVGIPLRARRYGHFCVRDKAFGDCLLHFARSGDGWRLVGVADPSRLDGP